MMAQYWKIVVDILILEVGGTTRTELVQELLVAVKGRYSRVLAGKKVGTD